jgi:acetyl-CoA carboxylase biotin carboxyl carrier protein
MKTKRKSEGQAAGVDFGAVERVLEFMNQHGIEEFEYSNGNFHIRLKKPTTSSTYLPRANALPEIVLANSSSGLTPAAEERSTSAHDLPEDMHIIKSPIVGTFYEAPSPGAEPFVSVGDRVAVGQVLCIIEAMKLMNEIESEVAGEIIRIYVENGQPVEYGESLFALRPTRKK